MDIRAGSINKDVKSNKRFSFEVNNQVFCASNEVEKQSWVRTLEAISRRQGGKLIVSPVVQRAVSKSSSETK